MDIGLGIQGKADRTNTGSRGQKQKHEYLLNGLSKTMLKQTSIVDVSIFSILSSKACNQLGRVFDGCLFARSLVFVVMLPILNCIIGD